MSNLFDHAPNFSVVPDRIPMNKVVARTTKAAGSCPRTWLRADVARTMKKADKWCISKAKDLLFDTDMQTQ